MRASRARRLEAWVRPSGRRPFVLGHRGARHGAPENTFAAFDRALAEGADGVELDVRLDGDGRVIVLHDPTLARVSGGKEPREAEALGAAELGRVDVGGGERVPLLGEVLAWSRERGARVNVELKRDVRRPVALVEGVVRCVRAGARSEELVLFSSFHPAFVAALAVRLPGYARAWLVHDRQRVLKRAPFFFVLGADGVHPQHTLLTAQSVARFKRSGAIVNTWTVNEASEALRVAALGVDGIVSDVPGAILEALSR